MRAGGWSPRSPAQRERLRPSPVARRPRRPSPAAGATRATSDGPRGGPSGGTVPGDRGRWTRRAAATSRQNGRGSRAVLPRSRTTISPVKKRDLLLARYTARSPTSVGCPTRSGVQAVERVAGFSRVGVRGEMCLAEIGGDPPGSDRVAPGAVHAQVDRHRAGHAVEACLGSAIGRMTRVRGEAFDGADVDDAPAAAPPHVRYSGLGEEQGCSQVDGEHELPLVQPDVGDGALEHDPGVVDEDSNAAEPLDRALHGRGGR